MRNCSFDHGMVLSFLTVSNSMLYIVFTNCFSYYIVLVLDFVSVVVIVIVLLIYFDLVLALVIVTKISLHHTQTLYTI